MSIQSEITLLQNTKDGLRTAIMEKGVTVYDSDLFSTYPTRISQISMTPGDKDTLFRSILERNVTELEIPEGAKYIAADRFRDITTLTSLTIPSTVDLIGDFAFNGCTSLESITINAVNPPGLNSFTDGQTTYLPFDDTNNCPIYVPKDSVDAYKNASNEGWTRYASRIQAVQELATFTKIPADDAVLESLEDGKYLIVDDAHRVALNTSLIQSTTTSTSGLNASDNYVPVAISSDGSTAKAPVSAAVDFVGWDNGLAYLAWIDEDSGTTYYLSMTSNRFTYTNTTSLPSQQMAIFVPANNTGWAFTDLNYSRTIRLNTSGTKFQWLTLDMTSSDIVYPSLYKLEE